MMDLSIAEIGHEVNRVYARDLLGETRQKPWDDAPDWRRVTRVHSVRFIRDNLSGGGPTPREVHVEWRDRMVAMGWTRGPYNLAAKKHPSITGWPLLTDETKAKSSFFLATVLACLKAEEGVEVE